MAVDKVSHVLSQLALQASRLDVTNKTNSVWIKCPYHGGGNERTPSCKINTTDPAKPPGTFFCFGCKTAGSWNKLAATLNLAGFKAADQINDVFAFAINDDSERTRKLPEFEKLKKWKRDRIWRTISGDVVRKFKGCKPDNPVYEDEFIYFPVLIHRKHVGGIYARLIVNKRTKKLKLSSYLNTSGQWTKTSLFGYNLAKKRRGPLWIVEGPRDTMKIYMMGGRVVGLCGAYISAKKIALIEALDPPLVIIATDPDDAGKIARKKLREALHEKFPIVDAIFPEGKDPGNFTPRSYRKMMLRMNLGEYL